MKIEENQRKTKKAKCKLNFCKKGVDIVLLL